MNKFYYIIKDKFHPVSNYCSSVIKKVTETQEYQDLKNFVFAKSFEESNVQFSNDENIRSAISKPIKFALTVIYIAVGFFVVWGGLAPLDQAATAPGWVMVSSNHKNIQHLEGGIIENILVKDGDQVKAGQVLIKLKDTHARTTLDIIKSQYAHALAEQARLAAEQTETKAIEWYFHPLERLDQDDLARLKLNQQTFLEQKLSTLNDSINIINEQITQKNEEIKGLEFQLTAAQSQEKNYAAEIASTQELLKKGLAHKPRLMELKRAHDEFTGRIGNITSAIAGARQEITQLNIKLIAIKNDFHHKVSDEIKDNHRIILELDEKYTAAKDTLERTEIKAPVDGIVSELKHFTIGGIIPPGQNIMDIVPADDKLIIEAQVPTQDIDSIYPGMLAKVQFSAFKARTVPRVEGKVIYIAPDRHIDERGGAPYYLVRIEVDDKEFDKLTANVKLYPGMPATVFIIKGTRTMLQYLLSPLMDSFYRSFKET